MLTLWSISAHRDHGGELPTRSIPSSCSQSKCLPWINPARQDTKPSAMTRCRLDGGCAGTADRYVAVFNVTDASQTCKWTGTRSESLLTAGGARSVAASGHGPARRLSGCVTAACQCALSCDRAACVELHPLPR